MTHSPDQLDELRADVNAFIAKHGLAPTWFGVAVLNDGSFVADLNGEKREVRLTTIRIVRAFMAGFDAALDQRFAVTREVVESRLMT